jgi:hypothetical protein
MDLIHITPVDKIKSYKVDSFRVFVDGLILNKSARILVHFYENSYVNGYQDNKYVMGENLMLEGEDYQKWQDDEYIYDYVCNKFSLNRLNNLNDSSMNNVINTVNNINYVRNVIVDVSNNITYVSKDVIEQNNNKIDINDGSYSILNRDISNNVVDINNIVLDLSNNNTVLDLSNNNI